MKIRNGFILTELIVVIASIALLVAIFMPAQGKVREIANRVVCGTNLKGFGNAVTVYANDFDGMYPCQGKEFDHTWGDLTDDWMDPKKDWSKEGGITVGASMYLLVRLAAVPGIQDTQCGFKAFRREVARQVFPMQTIEGWGFDVEVLFIARRLGYQIVEIPVRWYYGRESKVKPVRDTLAMVRDLLQVRRNARRGLYDRP